MVYIGFLLLVQPFSKRRRNYLKIVPIIKSTKRNETIRLLFTMKHVNYLLFIHGGTVLSYFESLLFFLNQTQTKCLFVCWFFIFLSCSHYTFYLFFHFFFSSIRFVFIPCAWDSYQNVLLVHFRFWLFGFFFATYSNYQSVCRLFFFFSHLKFICFEWICFTMQAIAHYQIQINEKKTD